ncbi:MAG: hypothetical protein ABI855_07555 [Bacteroidota bacterium]
MKARQLNKLYQLMRVSRTFKKHKEKMIRVPGMKKVIKSFDDKIDDLLIYVFKQKEDITYAAKQKRKLREEVTESTVHVCYKASAYFYGITDHEHLRQVDHKVSDFRKLSEVVFPLRVTNVVNVARNYTEELKSWGLKEKELQKIEEFLRQYDKIVSIPRNLQCSKATTTDSIKKSLTELDKIQCNLIDNIAKSVFETGVLKNEYRRARKIVQHKHPEGMFDEMLRIYRGGKKKKKVSRIEVLRGLVKDAVAEVG